MALAKIMKEPQDMMVVNLFLKEHYYLMKCWAQGMQSRIIRGTYHLWQAAVFLMALFQPMTSYFGNQILSVPISRENIKI